MKIYDLMGLLCLALIHLSRAEEQLQQHDGVEMICLQENPGDCYPKIFQPTKDFQIIREGQDLPPGLHVQMDMTTGIKQARLDIPEEGEATPEIIELSKEQAIVVVPQPEEAQPEPSPPAGAPVYESAGKIQPPPPTSGDEISTFQKALLGLKMEARSFDTALNDLLDLAHDLYYGLEIVKDGPVLEKLICLTLGSGTQKFPARDNNRGKKAAQILKASLQNNPTALAQAADFWGMIFHPNCGPDMEEAKIQRKGDFVNFFRNNLGKEKDPATLKAKAGAISSLLREERFRTSFLEKKGMELLLAMFLKKGAAFDIVREKVAQAVMDNFLNEELGAAIGLWPKDRRAEMKTCEMKKKMLKDGCWEHHVETYLVKQPGTEWAKVFLEKLTEGRVRANGKDEL